MEFCFCINPLMRHDNINRKAYCLNCKKEIKDWHNNGSKEIKY